MALIHSFEQSGNTLFRYRGQIPVVLFLLAIPVVWLTDYDAIPESWLMPLRITAIILSAIGFVIRAITIGTTPRGTSGRNTKEQVAESLNSTGIYSTCRHPLYLGNYFMWIGIVAYVFNPWFVMVVSLAYWLYYERIMFAEERFLERKFGKSYLDWSMNAPSFWPSFKKYRKSVVPFSMKSVFRREYSGVLATVIGFVFVDLLRDYFTMSRFEFNMVYLYVLAAAVVFALGLRTIKRNTSLLKEEGRS